MHTKIYDDQLIVITGAAGFIGSGVVRHLNDLGFYNLLLVDDLDSSLKWKNLIGKKYFDLIRIDDLFSWLEGREKEIEAFIHLGACSDTTLTDGDYFVRNNYRYSVKLAEYALTNGHRFVYASSAATYGNGEKGFSDTADLDELEPLNIYGFSKHLFDLWLKNQGALDDVVGLKYFNIFGPNEWHKGRMGSMVMHMTRQIQQEGRVKLFKSNDPTNFLDGEQCRDFFYVKDAVKMTCDFLVNDANGIFNVGRGEPVTWNELAHATFSALGMEPRIEYVAMPQDLNAQYQNFTCADMNKYKEAMEESDTDAVVPLSIGEAVRDYVQNHLLPHRYW